MPGDMKRQASKVPQPTPKMLSRATSWREPVGGRALQAINFNQSLNAALLDAMERDKEPRIMQATAGAFEENAWLRPCDSMLLPDPDATEPEGEPDLSEVMGEPLDEPRERGGRRGECREAPRDTCDEDCRWQDTAAAKPGSGTFFSEVSAPCKTFLGLWLPACCSPDVAESFDVITAGQPSASQVKLHGMA
mmetsp:Transcript_96723/g.282766  ORF Transcript_96723/g.282766 Transcript_96723/m.282766 type:complete len:192 (+) Transcript_96723:72-647(+)